ncbi:hypothetical protein H4I95_04751 [Botrytis cinerea]
MVAATNPRTTLHPAMIRQPPAAYNAKGQDFEMREPSKHATMSMSPTPPAPSPAPAAANRTYRAAHTPQEAYPYTREVAEETEDCAVEFVPDWLVLNVWSVVASVRERDAER